MESSSRGIQKAPRRRVARVTDAPLPSNQVAFVRPEIIERIAEFKYKPPKSAPRRILMHPEQYVGTAAWARALKYAPKINQEICITAATYYVNGFAVDAMTKESEKLFGVKLSKFAIYKAIKLVLLKKRDKRRFKIGRPFKAEKQPMKPKKLAVQDKP